MHCHTREGSIDARVSVLEYARLLKDQGFSGMLVTDHDSYRGYRYAMKHPKEIPEGFSILEGIEYDTKDAGHVIVIMPECVDLKLLEIRGMSLETLTSVVHSYGGVLGPAHPYGMKSSSAMHTRRIRRDPEILYEMDFMEGFNSCDRNIDNLRAQKLAKSFGLPCTGGSDSHKRDYIGTAYTEFDRPIQTTDDMIECILDDGMISFGGKEREFKNSKHVMRNMFAATWGFKAYNRGLGLVLSPYRRSRLNKMILEEKHHPGKNGNSVPLNHKPAADKTGS